MLKNDWICVKYFVELCAYVFQTQRNPILFKVGLTVFHWVPSLYLAEETWRVIKKVGEHN